jgi:hypothetical protein
VLLAIGAGAVLISRQHHDSADRQHCLINRADPAVEVLAFDTSDPLVRAHARSVREIVEDSIESLPTNGRFVVVELNPDAPSEINPLYEACKPGNDGAVARTQLKENFTDPVMAVFESMQDRPAARESPLVELVLAIAGDRTLRDDGAPITVRLVSDAMQNSALWSAYNESRRIPLPSDADALDGVHVEIHLLRNTRDAHLQRAAVAELAGWLESAGATVHWSEPPWMALLASEAP